MLSNHLFTIHQHGQVDQVPPSLFQPWITGLNHLTKDTQLT